MDVRPGTVAEASDVLALGPDVVIVATGGSPRMPDLTEGADLVVSTWDIIAGTVTPSAGEILVYDDHGTDEALSCVERLAAAGHHVEIVTPDRYVGHDVTGTAYPAYLAAFYAGGVRMTPDLRVTAVRRDGGRSPRGRTLERLHEDHLARGSSTRSSSSTRPRRTRSCSKLGGRVPQRR